MYAYTAPVYSQSSHTIDLNHHIPLTYLPDYPENCPSSSKALGKIYKHKKSSTLYNSQTQSLNRLQKLCKDHRSKTHQSKSTRKNTRTWERARKCTRSTIRKEQHHQERIRSNLTTGITRTPRHQNQIPPLTLIAEPDAKTLIRKDQHHKDRMKLNLTTVNTQTPLHLSQPHDYNQI